MHSFFGFCDCQRLAWCMLYIVDVLEYIACLLHSQSIIHIYGGLHTVFQILQQKDE